MDSRHLSLRHRLQTQTRGIAIVFRHRDEHRYSYRRWVEEQEVPNQGQIKELRIWKVFRRHRRHRNPMAYAKQVSQIWIILS